MPLSQDYPWVGQLTLHQRVLKLIGLVFQLRFKKS